MSEPMSMSKYFETLEKVLLVYSPEYREKITSFLIFGEARFVPGELKAIIDQALERARMAGALKPREP